MPKLLAWVLGLVFVLAACSGTPPSASKDDQDFAKHFVSLLRARDFDQIYTMMTPELKAAASRDLMEKGAAFFPADEPTNVQLVNWNQIVVKPISGEQYEHFSIAFQYQFAKAWILCDVSFLKKNGSPLIDHFNILPLPDSLQNINRFTFEGKNPAFYVFLALTVLVPLVILTAIVACVLTPMRRRKWLWLLFILVGIGQLSLNWTSGALFCNPLFLQLLGSGESQSGLYGPVILHISLPLGAIVFLIRRRRLDRRNDPTLPVASPFTPPSSW